MKYLYVSMRITSRRDKTRKGAAGEGTVGFGLIAFSTRDIEKENVYIKSNATKRNLRTLIATNRDQFGENFSSAFEFAFESAFNIALSI